MTETTSQLPPEARAWLREIERRLHALPREQRAETVAGLADHFAELTAAGVGVPEALARLGSAQDVAEAAFEQYQQHTGVDARPRYFTAKRVVQFVALAFAAAAVLAVALLPSYIQVSQTSSGSEQIGSATVLEVVGIWYLLVLLIPVAITALPLPATGRAWQPLSITSASLLTAFAVLGSLSIGWYFLPSAITAVVGACLPSQSRRRASGK